MTIETMKQWIFPLNMVIFHSFLYVFQRVTPQSWDGSSGKYRGSWSQMSWTSWQRPWSPSSSCLWESGPQRNHGRHLALKKRLQCSNFLGTLRWIKDNFYIRGVTRSHLHCETQNSQLFAFLGNGHLLSFQVWMFARSRIWKIRSSKNHLPLLSISNISSISMDWWQLWPSWYQTGDPTLAHA